MNKNMNMNNIKETQDNKNTLINHLKNGIIELENDIVDYHNKHSIDGEVRQTLIHKLHDLNVENKQLEKSNQIQLEELETLKSRMELQDKYLNEYKSNYIRVEGQINQIKNQYTLLKDSYGKLNQHFLDKENEKTKYLQTIDELSMITMNLKNEKQNWELEKKELDKTIQTQSSTIEEKDDELKKSIDYVELYRNELIKLENEKNELIRLLDSNIRSQIDHQHMSNNKKSNNKYKKNVKQFEEEDEDNVSPASYSFWEVFYESGEGKGDVYEWYVDYSHIRDHLLNNMITPYYQLQQQQQNSNSNRNNSLELLHVGCGNSLLAEELIVELDKNIDAKILNIDVCNNAIERMQQRMATKITNTRIKNGLEYRVGDATNTGIANDTYDGIIDKGTVDALLSTLDLEVGDNQMVKKLLREMYRVLKPGGFLLVVSRNTCAEPYFYMDDQAEWSVQIQELQVSKQSDSTTTKKSSSKAPPMKQINYLYSASKPTSANTNTTTN
ncbi:hypothetical protein DFA_08501 [Cavenderia fasciculata]|uniref:Methyltransferase type 11 domain-containing protein n=1 Tax=Cavenderia fasciculata TaxID=261658 RepID=F4Q2N8_CACFS|nr:uncharacterized protein DFA_08501 [Cavenderia fasciculata]EGG17505.1 hypothetical protein DFA_08501 [Cavenderia fasciculata]|eukprot:XP_004355989.1 hypothetical protein DFA_08501 [Cavenderia fasciculata]